MNAFWRAAAVVALATGYTSAQDFGQFLAGPSELWVTAVAKEDSPAVYETISDTEGPAYEPVAFEEIGNGPDQATDGLAVDEPTVLDVAFVGDVLSNTDLSPALIDGASGVSWVETGNDYGLPSPDFSALAPGCEAGCACDSCGTVCSGTCRCCGGIGFYGEALYLRARNAEVAYAVPIDGPIVDPVTNPLQVGNYGILDPDYSLGFRAGVTYCWDAKSSVDVGYTFFESLTNSAIKTEPPLVLRSLVAHPSSGSAAADFLAASGQVEVDFDLVDANFRHAMVCRQLFRASGVIGARYAKLEQQFNSEFIGLGSETVNTDIDFDGGGFRLGLEAQRFSRRHQLHVYANGYASFLAGRFRGSYFQGQSFDPTVVSTEWAAGRVVPILDLELGVGWTSCNGKLRLASGYMVNAWFNTLTTQEFIRAIQGNDLVDLGQTMTFDGLNARLEYRF